MADVSRIKTVFLEAIETCRAEDWPEFLNRTCDGDEQLRQQVERMLEAHQQCLAQSSGSDTVAGTASADTDDSFFLISDNDEVVSIGHFELTRLVGRGGMGSVFCAHDRKLDRRVAVKIPRLSIFGNPKLKDRFLREAKTAAGLSHDGLVAIHEFGASGQVCYLVTEWCAGGDLSQWLRDHPGPHPPQAVAMFVRKLAEAVAHCHRSNVLHLDIKPANILLEDTSNTVADFPG
ncbi:MAG: serine/threonine protein kinase, partial [Planctomycetaceae bacterium]|nr:serine/threonine protein kinase [Planctomycetaceae bacterium]